MQAFLLGRVLDRLRSRHDHRPHFRIDMLSLRHSRRRPQVFDARVSARTMNTRSTEMFSIGVPDQDPCRPAPAPLRAGQPPARNCSTRERARLQPPPFQGSFPGNERRKRSGVDLDHAIEFSSGIAGQCAPVCNRVFQFLPLGAKRRPLAYANVVSSGAINPARAPASMLILQSVMRPSIDNARTASPAYSMTCPVAPSVPMRPMIPSAKSFASRPPPVFR